MLSGILAQPLLLTLTLIQMLSGILAQPLLLIPNLSQILRLTPAPNMCTGYNRLKMILYLFFAYY